jgi:hypothetical protein
MTTEEQKKRKVSLGFTLKIEDDLRSLIAEIRATRMLNEKRDLTIGQVVSDLIRTGAKKDFPSIAK